MLNKCWKYLKSLFQKEEKTLMEIRIDALESGEYKQGMQYLKRGDEYCCLGVGAEVFGVDWERAECTDVYMYIDSQGMLNGKDLDPEILEALNISQSDMQKLIRLNDTGYSFESIANYIRELSRSPRGAGPRS